MRFYGWDKFVMRPFAPTFSKADADVFETAAIAQERSSEEDFRYDIAAGGEGISSELARKF